MAASALQAYAYGNCTYYVAKRFPNIYPYLGNAAEWVKNARTRGYTVLNKPTADTVAVYGPSQISPLGHVAVVDSVNSDGSFVVSEMNNPYTPGGGFNHVDSRTVRSTAGIIGFVVPPGSSYKATATVAKKSACVTGSVTIPAAPLSGGQPTVVCFDGLMGVSAMVGGALIIGGGIAILLVISFKNSAVGAQATRVVGMFGGPVGAAVAASTTANAPRPSPEKAKENDATAAAASAARTATAKARLSPEASTAVAEAKAGRGSKLSPQVKDELRSKAA